MENLTQEQQQYIRKYTSHMKFTAMAEKLKCSVEQVRAFAQQVWEERKAEEQRKLAEDRAKREAAEAAFEKQQMEDYTAAGKDPVALRKYWDKYYSEDVIEELDLSEAKQEVYCENEDKYWDEAVSNYIDYHSDQIGENAYELFEEDESEEIQAAIREFAKEEIDEALDKAFAKWIDYAMAFKSLRYSLLEMNNEQRAVALRAFWDKYHGGDDGEFEEWLKQTETPQSVLEACGSEKAEVSNG